MLVELIIIQVITFLAIVLVLKRLLYTETAREAGRLKILKEETAQKQRELQEKIDAAENVYKEKLAKAQEDIRRISAKAEEEREEKRRTIVDKAKEEAERILQVVLNTKEKIREEISIETNKKIPQAASRIFREALSQEAKGVVHEELIEKLIHRVKELEKSRFNAKVKKGELLFAIPIKRDAKEKLLTIISEKIGHSVTFDERMDKQLVAGAVIALETLIIDGSLENQLRQICEIL